MIARKFCRLRTRLFVRYIDLYACIYGIRISRIRYDFEVQVADSDMHGPWRLAMAARSPHNMVELDNRLLLPRIRSELCTAVAVALAAAAESGRQGDRKMLTWQLTMGQNVKKHVARNRARGFPFLANPNPISPHCEPRHAPLPFLASLRIVRTPPQGSGGC